jgi:hypothetical protein
MINILLVITNFRNLMVINIGILVRKIHNIYLRNMAGYEFFIELEEI